MDENENESGYLEDSLEAYIGELIEFARGLPPGSDEQTKLNNSIVDLYNICIKYTEVGMRYRSEEQKIENELEMKKLELEMKEKELELEKNVKEAQLIEQKNDRRINAILDGLRAAVSVGTVATFACLQVTNMKAEYVDSRFMSSGVFKNISNIFGRMIKL